MFYRQISMFDEYITDEDKDNTVDAQDGYSLVQQIDDSNENYFKYKVFDRDGLLIAQWKSDDDCFGMDLSKYNKSQCKKIFLNSIAQDLALKDKITHNKNSKKSVELKSNPVRKFNSPTDDVYFSDNDFDEFDDDDILWGNYRLADRSSTRKTDSKISTVYKYTPPPTKKGYVDKLNKSDTLVIHKTDPTTTMLKQIYEGKGWDVLNDSYVDPNEIRQLLESHDRIVMLGHGSSYGLIGGNIGPDEAKYLKNKKLFVIWCNADKYFEHHNIGKGSFITGNMPSDAWEARAVGCNVSEPYMNENITYWCKLCGDVCERALEGDAQGAVDYVHDKYWEKYGQGYDVNDVPKDAPDEVKITKYNYDRTKVQR